MIESVLEMTQNYLDRILPVKCMANLVQEKQGLTDLKTNVDVFYQYLMVYDLLDKIS